MSLRSRVLKVAALTAVVLAPTVAFADADGIVGTVTSVVVNESSADDYSTERGSLIVNEGNVTRKYQWGGTACSGRNVSEANIQLLIEAMSNRDKLQIVPSYKTGAGLARCLVGFKLQVAPPLVAQ
jgi:hypothetical protein